MCDQFGRKWFDPMKRLCSLLLAAVLALTLLPAAALAAEEPMTTSAAGAEMIAGFEGYRQYAYYDGGQWYIGYGTACGRYDYPDGVTEEEALALMQADLQEREAQVNDFLQTYGISLTQYQFDALMSLTYNLGASWMTPGCRLGEYLINGVENYSKDQVVNAIATWCHVGNVPMESLARRRLQEAYLFLYGTYENNGAEEYVYVHYIAGTGEVAHTTMFYPKNHTYGTLQTPTHPSQYFQGWYTTGNTLLRADDIAVGNVSVTARYGGEPVSDTGVETVQWDNPFSDIQETDWYYAYIRNLSLAGQVDGYPDGTFKPGREVTAGEGLKMLLMSAGYGQQEPLAGGHWASGYLELAEEEGFLTPGEITDLDAPLSRGLVAKVAAQALQLPAASAASPFADTGDGYAVALYEAGILTGSYNTSGQLVYRPEATIVRSEVCTVMWKMSSYDPAEQVPEEPDEPDEPEDPDPGETGYIIYGNHKIPVLPDVAVNEYDRELFRLEGTALYYDDPDVETYLGIDVSSYQGDIDWQAVAADGIEYAFIRVGYRGYTAGSLNLDRYYEQNIQGALDAGLKVGVYFFSQAISVEEAVEEADYVLDAIRGYDITYPVVFDWETIGSSNARTNGLDAETLTDCAIAFCERVKSAGYIPMVYFNQNVAYLKMDLSRLTDYDFWYAQYPPESAVYPSIYYHFDIWQYTSSGYVDGIDGRVDRNISWKRW